MGRIHRIGAGDHTIPRATLTLCHIVEGVAEQTAVRPVVDARGQNVYIALRGELVKESRASVAVEAQVGLWSDQTTLRARRETLKAPPEGT